MTPCHRTTRLRTRGGDGRGALLSGLTDRLGTWAHAGQADPWSEGSAACFRGDLFVAEGLLRAVPPSHPQYAEAQQDLGFKLAVREHHNPLAGLHHLNRSFAADPLNPGIWQDLPRACWGATVQVTSLAWSASRNSVSWSACVSPGVAPAAAEPPPLKAHSLGGHEMARGIDEPVTIVQWDPAWPRLY